jgi:HJR/Mrr/RecB family endonuclease
MTPGGMKLANIFGMGRRRKSKEAALFESIAGLLGVGLLLYLISPGFRSVIQIIMLLVVVVVLIGLVVWIFGKLMKDEPSTAFKVIYADTDNFKSTVSCNIPVAKKEAKPTRTVPKLTISENLRKIDWYQFEKLIELIYRHRGFSVKRLGGANPDGGVDLIVTSSTEKFVVQCKHWRKWTVGVRHIREFLGTLTDSGVSKGVFITLTGYSGDARQLAEKHGIQILNETDVIQMLEKSGLTYSREISELFNDERKICPKCEQKMVLRTARMNGNRFWGCSSFPRCKFIMNWEAKT